jgi:RimJ/RimL family protein N-acetyltransferase
MAGQAHPIRLPSSLTDGVVTLDTHSPSDAAQIVAGEDEEIGRRFDGGRPTTLAKADAFIRQYAERWAVGGPEITFALRLSNGTLIGGAEIRRAAPQQADVGYWVYPAFRGNGYARRALVLLCAAARDGIAGLTDVSAHIDADNLASRRTAEAAGFVEAGTVEENGISRLRFIRSLGADA